MYTPDKWKLFDCYKFNKKVANTETVRIITPPVFRTLTLATAN